METSTSDNRPEITRADETVSVFDDITITYLRTKKFSQAREELSAPCDSRAF